MDDPIEQFLSWSMHDRNRSPHTLARYRLVLTRVAAYDDLLTIDRADIDRWWQDRYHLAPRSRANELFCLRSFFNWATAKDHRLDDPTRGLDAPQIAYDMPRPIGEADLMTLLRVTEDHLDLRRAICLGAYAGMRVSEAAGLDWSGIDQEAHRIYVRGKGRKERVFGLGSVLLDKLLPETGGNVVKAGGRPYSGAVLQRKINRLMARHLEPYRAATETEEAKWHTFHDLRKRAATLAMAKTGNAHGVAAAFGWSSIETAASYAKVSDDVLDQIAAAVV